MDQKKIIDMDIPVKIQYRHVHLSDEDVVTLFGQDLGVMREIEQKGQFVSSMTVTLIGPKGSIGSVRVLGPKRKTTQVEISMSDAMILGIKAHMRMSGDLKMSASLVLKGTKGQLKAIRKVIVPIRHLHVPKSVAKILGVEHGDVVSLRLPNLNNMLVDCVAVRVHPTFTPAFHLSPEEAAMYWLHSGDTVKL